MIMTIFGLLLLLSSLLFESCALANLLHDSTEVSFAVPPSTVKSIDLNAYLGRWYQMYASKTPNQTYERNGYCLTADYYGIPNKNIAFGLTNSQR